MLKDILGHNLRERKSDMVTKRRSKGKQPTMRDVAELAVCRSRLFQVLNQNDTNIPISEETRDRVQAAIAELGYRPNFAVDLHTQRTEPLPCSLPIFLTGFYHPWNAPFRILRGSMVCGIHIKQ